MTENLSEISEREVFHRVVRDVLRNLVFVAGLVGVVFLLSGVSWLVSGAFWLFVLLAALGSLQFILGSVVAGIGAHVAAHRQGLSVPGTGWLWLGGLIRGIETAVLWYVVLLLRTW